MSAWRDLFGNFPQPGRVEWIGVRPQREARPVSVREIRALEGVGLQGDHYGGGANGKRHVTLIQHEHLDVVARLLAMRVSQLTARAWMRLPPLVIVWLNAFTST
jgi:MOSC domain-containing protein YiiM